MTGDERKRLFKSIAARRGETLSAASLLNCGVTWDHLSKGISDRYETPLSPEVKEKFAAYVCRSVDELFGVREGADAA